MAVQRRLAAILAADVAGYSRLMGEDEEGTLATLTAHLTELIEPCIAEQRGRMVKTTGDGLLAEFASVVDAVRCAVAFQEGMAERNADTPEDRRIEFRIGVNLGDVIVQDDDVYGDGVNVAARLEGLAEPGGVIISGKVYEEARSKLAFGFDDLGSQEFKNIAEPVRAYRVRGAADAVPIVEMETDAVLPLPDRPSIAVLPFQNMSGDPEQEYFADGMAEDLITDISKISGVFVTARNSSFAFKGQKIDVKDIAKKLGVKHVVEGSVRKMGSKLRINAQLIDAASGGHVWAERYDGDMEDIFQFQDDIREQIVSALQVNLTPADKVLAEHKPTNSAEAYDLFLRGRASYYHHAREHLFGTIKCFEEAIELDPNFADAYAYLSYCHFQGFNQMLPGFDDGLDRAIELAETGVALDDASAIALIRLGWVQTWLRRYDQAIASLEKALALAPNNADVLATFGNVLNFCGDPERGLRMMERALSIETFPPPSWEFQIGRSHLLLGQYDQAVTRFNRMVDHSPTFLPAYTHLAVAYFENDRIADARDAINTVLKISPQFTVNEAEKRLPYRNEKVRDRFLDSLRKAGLPE